MASATARPIFSFHHLPHLHHPPKTHISFIPKKPPTILKPSLHILLRSTDVSQEDNPLYDPTAITSEPPEAEEEEAPESTIDPRRLEERFAVLNTGIFECRSCGYLYNESAGDPSYPLPPGYQFSKLPDDWRCPTCGAAQSFFVSKSIEIAGFAQNQQFGLGGNTLTSGQKALVIYGSLLLGFGLFLSGYFLQ